MARDEAMHQLLLAWAQWVTVTGTDGTIDFLGRTMIAPRPA